MIRFLIGLSVQTVLFTALIIGPAWAMTGGLDWPRGWLAVALLFAASAGGGLFFARTDPGLVRERASIPRPRSTADTLATLLIVVLLIAWFVGVDWDVHRLHLPTLPSGLSIGAGLVGFLIGLGVIVWTFRVNSFAAPVVKIQDERGQRVIDTGPYAMVRHPMYMGAILFLAGADSELIPPPVPI